MKLTIDTDYCPVRNFDDVCSLCNCECISGEALTRDCPLIRNGGTPYNLTGDCISREALKDFAYINKGNFNTVEGIREWIDNAPPVEHERPQGEWIKTYNMSKRSYRRICTNCYNISYFCGDGDYPNCPYCLADMRKGGTE